MKENIWQKNKTERKCHGKINEFGEKWRKAKKHCAAVEFLETIMHMHYIVSLKIH